MGSSFPTEKNVLYEFGKKCLGKNEGYNESSEFCPKVFDGFMCWEKTKIGETAIQSCSSNYLLTPSNEGFATLLCEKTGKWFIHQNNQLKADYSECGQFFLKNVDNEDIYTRWLPILRRCTHVGYGFSIVSLVLALFIFIYFKKLHCARNYLHINLFVSSLMRCFMSILKDVLFANGTTLFTDIPSKNELKQTFWFCRAVISLRQYFIITNFTMLLMESIYLHNLIFLKLVSDKTSIRFYAIAGWVLPLLFVSPWIILRVINGSNLCWTKKDYTSLLIEIPTGTIVVINFILFISIVRILFVKLNSMFTQQRKLKYRKLVKSTLILLPLFGVPYTISVALSFYISLDRTLEIIWLFFDQSFTAFQGFLAAFAYCLLNGDVQTEIRRFYIFYSRDRINESRRSRTISHTLQSILPSCDEDFNEYPTLELQKLENSTINHF